jgi:hypothetical protein
MTIARAWLYVWYGCGLVGVGILVWSAVDWQRTASFNQVAVEAKGMIVGAKEQDLGRGRTRYFSQVEFMTSGSKRHRFLNPNWKAWPPHVGDVVPVLYDPVMPDRARVNEPDDRGLLRMLLAVMGLCLTLVGLSPLVFKTKTLTK